MNILNISVLFSILLGFGFPTNNGFQISEFSDLMIVASAKTNFDFESCTVNLKPENWSVALTGNGKMCNWKIVDDAGNKVLAQLSDEKNDYRFNLIVNNELSFKDVNVELKFKGVAGNVDQGGGPVWRYINENNYYVARANPLENNYRVYKVVNGRRIQLESARVTINAGEWYNLKVTMKGDKIKCYFNGKLKLETTDSTFKKAGKVGLWTKADAVTYFDNFKVN
jgi:hypothetical protein